MDFRDQVPARFAHVLVAHTRIAGGLVVGRHDFLGQSFDLGDTEFFPLECVDEGNQHAGV